MMSSRHLRIICHPLRAFAQLAQPSKLMDEKLHLSMS